jgi:hypothetical protein
MVGIRVAPVSVGDGLTVAGFVAPRVVALIYYVSLFAVVRG